MRYEPALTKGVADAAATGPERGRSSRSLLTGGVSGKDNPPVGRQTPDGALAEARAWIDR